MHVLFSKAQPYEGSTRNVIVDKNAMMDLLKELNERDKLTIIVVTHESGVANYTNKIIHIKDGIIGEIEENQAHNAVRFGSDGTLK